MAINNNSSYVATLSEIEKKAQRKVLSQRANHEAEEYRIQAEIDREKELSERRERFLIEEEKYATEMFERNRLRVIDAKKRQQIRESNQELRELECKLRAAYVGKSIRLQLAEKEANRIEEKLNLRREQQLIAESRLADQLEIEETKRQERENQTKLRIQLIKQIEDKALKKQMMYKEFLQEKRRLDDIVQRIQDERIADLNEASSKKENLRKGLEESQRMKAVWKQREKKEIEEENRRILMYLQEQEIRNEEAKVLKNEKLKHSFAIAERMGTALKDAEDQAQRREELLLALKIEEMNEQAEMKERQNLEQKVRRRIQVRLQLEQQKEDNYNRLVMAENEDKQFRLEQLQLLSERDRVDQMTAEKRRRIILDHQQAVREILEQRQKEREVEREKLAREHIYEMDQQREILKIIEEERLKILKEHASELIGYFPPGILRESDRAHLQM